MLVVLAEDRGRAALGHRGEQDREQVVRAGVVHRRDAGADHVEVAQAGVPEGRLALELGGAGDVAQHPLADELALAVRRLRVLRRLLRDEVGVGRAEHRGAAGEHDVAHARGEALLEQDARALDVDAERVERLAHADTGVLQRRHVHDALDTLAAEDARDGDVIGDRPVHHRYAGRHERLAPAVHVVEHDRVDALVREGTHHVRSDVPGAACHNPRHGSTLGRSRWPVSAHGVRSPGSQLIESPPSRHRKNPAAAPKVGRRPIETPVLALIIPSLPGAGSNGLISLSGRGQAKRLPVRRS